MDVRVGTSGFGYASWRGRFYPADLAPSGMLGYYAERFSAVEINSTFYRMPSAGELERWAAGTPDDFVFVLKAPRSITHVARLAGAGPAAAVHLLGVAASLGAKLGPVLFQLPPSLGKDVARLEAFLASLPAACQPAFEFRHRGWLTDEVFELLRRRDAALVISDADDGAERPPTHAVTSSWGYVRLRRTVLGDEEMSLWADRIAARPWRTVFVFLKHEDEGRAPALAARLAAMLEQRLHSPVTPPPGPLPDDRERPGA